MPLNSAAKSGVSPISSATRVPGRTDLAAATGVKAPVVKRSERLPEPALAVLANQLDAFIEADAYVNAAIIDRLKTVADGESVKDLEDATSAMRRFAVLKFFQRDSKPDLSDPALKTFARLWPKAEALGSSAKGNSAHGAIELEFNLAFGLMINLINGPQVSLTPRK